ncbi:hypothetical protein HF289_03225 [Acidithiobacillus ferrooxidans]|uniref:hypothetical protein n=1 Tax=Acidithiobacillus ferrooxidans TaxID=920 RepID=UPI001C07113A|nr:hypothetical protein [Acidithiobacillus ferrooxidans]MBU2855923.1 hypothetical protein [Acidithiobacillus ferrooxidans]
MDQNENSSNIEAMIPVGLTGQIRDKARDALVTASVILGMSRTDILDRIQELSKENGLTPQSARVWLLFAKEVQDQSQSVGRQIGNKGSQRTYAHDLGYRRADIKTLGLGAVFRREVTGTGMGKNAVDDMRRELNREAGHHGDSVGGRHGAFSYDQMVDGWGGAGGGRDADGGGVGLRLDGHDGDTSLDLEAENEFGADGLQLDIDDHEQRPGDSVMTPGDLHDVHLPDGRHRGASGHEIDHLDVLRAGNGGVYGGPFKGHATLEARREMVDRQVAALERKLGGFRGTDAEFAAFAQANPDLGKNQLRLIRKGLSDKDYLGYRVYVENAEILDNKERGGAHIATQTKACLLLASDDSARRFQNSLREKIRLLSRIPDSGLEKLSFSHLERMQTSFPRLVDEFQSREKAKDIQETEKKRDEIKAYRKANHGKNRDEPGLER